MAKMRSQVRRFAHRMEVKLTEHDEGRGSVEWHGEPASVMFVRLVSAVAELGRGLPDNSKALDREAMTERSVNVANITMMLADVFGV